MVLHLPPLSQSSGEPALRQVPAWCEPEWRQVIEVCWELAPDARCVLPDLARHLEAIIAATCD